jgi:hypothetical protein
MADQDRPAEQPDRADGPHGQSPAPGWSNQQPPPYQPVSGWGSHDAPPPGTPSGWTPPPPAPKPGVVPLRPLGVGDIMSGAIDYVRRDPKTVIAIAAMVGFVAAVVQLGMLAVPAGDLAALTTGDPAAVDPAELGRLLLLLTGYLAVAGLITGVLQIFGTGMLTHVMGRAVIGRHTDLGRAWELVRPQLWRLIGATFLVGIVVIAAALLPLLPGALALVAGLGGVGGVLTGVGAIVAVVLAVWASFGLILTTPALALEDLGPITAMKRSWALVKGAFWRTLGIVLLGTIVGQAVGSLLAAPFSLIGGVSGELTTASVFGAAIAGLVTVLVALPFIAGVTALVYIDRRIRTEDLAPVLAAAAATSEDPSPLS